MRSIPFLMDPDLKALWDDGLNYEARRSAIAFGLIALLSCVFNLLVPSFREHALDQVVSMLMSKDVVTPEGNISFLGLFSSNMLACITTMLHGLIPFIHLPALALGLNAALIGVMAAHTIAEGSFVVFLAGIIPHGIFEIPALVLACAMGLWVCGQVSRRCKGDKSAHSFLESLTLTSKLLFLVLIPLLVLAAAVEAWVTPLVMTLFTH